MNVTLAVWVCGGVDVMVGVLVCVAVAVLVDEAVGVRVCVGVAVMVAVSVCVAVAVLVEEAVGVRVCVAVAVMVAVSVCVAVGVLVGEPVAVSVAVAVGVSVGEAVAVLVDVAVGVSVAEAVAVAVEVAVAVLVDVAVGHAAPDEQSVPDPGGVINEHPKSRLPELQAVGVLPLKAQKLAQPAKSMLSVLPEFEPVQQQVHSAALARRGAAAATQQTASPATAARHIRRFTIGTRCSTSGAATWWRSYPQGRRRSKTKAVQHVSAGLQVLHGR